MENSEQKPRRIFTPQQKFEIIKDIERCSSIREGLAKHGIPSSMFYKWKRQLAVGVNASLRNTKPLKSPDLKKLEEDNRKEMCSACCRGNKLPRQESEKD